MPEPVDVLLVTPVRLYAEGIGRALVAADGIGVVGTAPGCAEALVAAPHDVVVLDLSGIEDAGAARAFVRAVRPLPVVAFAVQPRDDEVVAWAERGAAGIVTLDATFEDLVRAIRCAAEGTCAASERVTTALLHRVAALAASREEATPRAALTDRERQIAELLVGGRSNKEIAMELTLGVSTVKNHVHHLLAKVDARTRGEAAARLVASGIQAPQAPGTGPAQARQG